MKEDRFFSERASANSEMVNQFPLPMACQSSAHLNVKRFAVPGCRKRIGMTRAGVGVDNNLEVEFCPSPCRHHCQRLFHHRNTNCGRNQLERFRRRTHRQENQ